MIPLLLALDADNESKATLDPSSIQGQEPTRANQKVELDLDDAPFLEDEEEEEEPVAPREVFAEAQAEELAITAPKPPNALIRFITRLREEAKRRKKLLALLLPLLLLALLAVPTMKLMFPKLEFEVQDKTEITPVQEEQAVAPSAPVQVEPTIEEFVIGLEPFWVEKLDAKGAVHFLHLKFAFTTLSPALEQEVSIKTLLLRDAIYYYLRNKDFEFLADIKNMEALKADLVAVVNQYIGNDQLDTLYIEKYLIQ